MCLTSEGPLAAHLALHFALVLLMLQRQKTQQSPEVNFRA